MIDIPKPDNATEVTHDVKQIGAPNSVAAPTTTADQAVTFARDVPSLIKNAAIMNPELAAKWTGKSLIASKSVWGTLITMGVSWGVTRWGLGWDSDTCAEVSGALVMVATAILRSLAELPITGIFRGATTQEAVASVVAKSEV